MGKYHYRAYCSNCGDTIRQSESRNFMSRFFLGDRCNQCGHYKNDRIWDNGWEVEFGHWERDKKFSFFNIKTWFSSGTWIEFKENKNDG